LGAPVSSRVVVSAIIRERPRFHAGGAACYKVSRELEFYLHDSLSEGDRTLETGAGVSTLILALRGCEHTAVTPRADEIEAIRLYAA